MASHILISSRSARLQRELLFRARPMHTTTMDINVPQSSRVWTTVTEQKDAATVARGRMSRYPAYKCAHLGSLRMSSWTNHMVSTRHSIQHRQQLRLALNWTGPQVNVFNTRKPAICGRSLESCHATVDDGPGLTVERGQKRHGQHLAPGPFEGPKLTI
ncbi:hypothetical protein J3459_010445 [Metarhizium acridum]|nr:hypothetical protein J3459_010445 [Metarhizium acridum]